MLNLDDRPAPPELPQFRQDMERLLLAAARASSPLRPAAATRRARYGVAGLAAAAVAAAAAAGIGYAASGGPHPTSVSPSTTHGGRVHIHRAAFSVDTNPGGTVTLKLTQGQMFDPAALRQALFKAHMHLQRIDKIAPLDPGDIGRLAALGGTPDKAPFVSPVDDFYLTNPIARASVVMAQCSVIAEGHAALTAAE